MFLACVALACSAHSTFAVDTLPTCRLGIEVPKRARLGTGAVMVVFNASRCYGVYENGRISNRIGKPIFGYAVTGGVESPTPLSDFHTGPQRILSRNENAVSSEYPIHPDGTRGGARMPYAQFIDVERGIAIHQGNIGDLYGSRGCIRLGPESARVLFEEFSQEELAVIVTQDRGSLRVLWEDGYFRTQGATSVSVAERDAYVWHEEPE